MAITGLYFGDSGCWKTTNMGFAALYEYERTGGKRVRLISSDGGGWRPIQDYIDAGIIEPYYIRDEPDMPVLLHKLARGWWPERLENGIRPKGVKLIPGIEGVGAYIWEGLTSSAELLMKWLRDKQMAIGPEAPGKFEVRDSETGDTYRFCSNSMKHYDWVQSEMLVIVGEFSALPIDRVLITAHEAQGIEEDTRLPIRGPALVGKAATDRVPRNVGDCIHFESYQESKTTGGIAVMQTRVRAFFQNHPDPKIPNVFYKCKTRIPSARVPELLARWPGGYFEPRIDRGLDEFLRFEDELLEKSTDHIRRRKEEIDRAIAARFADNPQTPDSGEIER